MLSVTGAAGYHFEPGFVAHHLGELGAGLLRTLAVSAVGMAGGLLVGALLGAVSALRVPVARQLVTVYVELFRNTPLLVQIFFLYFALPETGLRLGGFTAGWLSLLLWGGAYHTENFRAGFEAVESGRIEACRALGFGRLGAFRHVTLPLGARVAVPSVTNTLISVFKNSSFLVAIGYPELTETAVGIVAVTFRVFEVFLAIGVVYLLLVRLMSLGAGAVERRLATPGGH
ncbi:amino acid ABC transporter permease [Streptomyces sp. NPDC047002]|uniref:amino acid ABC transporter permease n=1 Tax=Streptomyces sp. NPDC047002 TaxID=3155475 RepID=UPI0034562037